MGDVISHVESLLTIAAVVWVVGGLALVEWLRRKFSTPKDLEAMEKRLCDKIEEAQKELASLRQDVGDWERYSEDKLASRAELNGYGARVGNLEHMFQAVQTLAQDAKQVALNSQSEIRGLREDVTRSSTLTGETNRKLEALLVSFAEVRTELRLRHGNGPITE
jgi:predicted  nucleic acid-binding Zn-ribbon protein